MSSLKDESRNRNNSSMSVTAPVSHVEMWPYVASAAALSESHLATAILIFPLAMTFPVLVQSPEFSTCMTPHDVDSHGVSSNAMPMLTSSSRHQTRYWSKAEEEHLPHTNL